MALVSLRQLLDHAAENGYGVPAFNVNNLEQMQAIMEAAQEADAPVIMQASAGARKYAGETVPAASDSGRGRDVPADSGRDAPGPRRVAGRVRRRDQARLSSVMMDGSLREDGKTVADYDYNIEGDEAKSSTWRMRRASASKANSAASARSRRCAAKRKTATAPRSR